MACRPIGDTLGIAECPQCGQLFSFEESDIQEIETVGTEVINEKLVLVLGEYTKRVVKCPVCGLFLDYRFILSRKDLFPPMRKSKR